MFQDVVSLEDSDKITELNNNIKTSELSPNKHCAEEDSKTAAIACDITASQPDMDIASEDMEKIKTETSLPSIRTSLREPIKDHRQKKPSAPITSQSHHFVCPTNSKSDQESDRLCVTSSTIHDESMYGLMLEAKPLRHRSVSSCEDEVSLRSHRRSMTLSSFGSYSSRSRKQSISSPVST